MEQKLKNYSSGMQVRLAFSIAIRARSDILLIDEVLAVGDLMFQQKCYDTFKSIKRQGRTVIFVSHDLGAIESFCDRAMILNRGKQISIGEPREMIAEYKALMAEEDEKLHGKRPGKGTHIVASGKVHIIKAEIIADNKVTAQIDEGQPFTVRVHYSAKEALLNPTFGIGIMNENGQSIIGPNTRESGVKIGEIKGSGFVDAKFKTNVLAPGLYTVIAAFFDETGVVPEDFVENLMKFKVSGPVRHGQIYTPPVWKIHNRAEN